MTEINLYNFDNMECSLTKNFDLIYCDYIYENLNFDWAEKYWRYLNNNGIFIAQTDWHSNHRLRVFMEDNLPDISFINELVWKNEWGNHPKDRFHQCFDNIIIYGKSKSWKFYSDRIQVPKATGKSKGLNPSGRETKTATGWIDDITLTTVAKERVKKSDGHLIRWQKPLKLYDRIILPFTDKGDWILDPFMGSGSLGLWCKNNNRNYVGIEFDKEVFELAKRNIREQI